MNKRMTAAEAVGRLKDNDTLLVGGFLVGGNPNELVMAVNETAAKDLTLISNDTGTTETALFALTQSGRVKKIYASYIGANPETGRLLMTGEAEVVLVPQGTLAEKIRAGGAGLGGFLTPVGVGTIVEEGKTRMALNGKDYLLEEPLRGQMALVRAHVADESGNLIIRGSSKNFNVVMATAADFVVAQVDEIVPTGALDPECITIPGIYIDAIVKVGA